MHSVEFDVQGQQYHAMVAGDPKAPLMLCLHGFPEYSGAWADVFPYLEAHFYCVAPDQRGYGQSWKPSEVAQYSMPHLVSDAAAMIAHFGQGRAAAAVVAHDWGASVGYALAMRYPQLLENLVVVNGVHPVPFQRALASGGAQTKASQYILALRKAGTAEALAKDEFRMLWEFFGKHMDMSWMTPEKRAQYMQAWGDAAGVQAMLNWYCASPLRVARPGHPLAADAMPEFDVSRLQVSMPHLVLWGARDVALLPETREGLGDFCTKLVSVDIQNADHWILHQEPEIIADEIRAFLA
nr:alpha/beta hydrolase [uncultured Shimia sp.]